MYRRSVEYMFDTSGSRDDGWPVEPVPVVAAEAGTVHGTVPSVAVITGWVAALAVPVPGVDSQAVLIDRIRVLEELKGAAAAAQARASAAFDVSHRRTQEAAGLSREDLGKGVGAQIALARRESPARGGQHVGLAKALVKEMPHTMAALSSGLLSEWRATLLVRETACLSVEDRRFVDAAVAADPAQLDGVGDARLIALVRQLAYRLDQQALVRRARKAEADRHVSCRPAPDTMTYLTGLLPVAQGVAVYAALRRAADSARAAGDARGLGQIMADTLVERVTGAVSAGNLNVEVQLVMTDRTLFKGDSEPAYLPGYGIVPADWARQLLFPVPQSLKGADSSDPGNTGDAGDAEVQVWLRRLYTAPRTGQLIAMDSRARLASAGLRRLIEVRDQRCRTPWCDAPIRHRDHIIADHADGKTSQSNLQGLCERCNQTKEAPGWAARPRSGIRHSVSTTTPTGHTYHSTAPPLPGTPAA